ncbi:MAG: Holliday junction branch migration protein RuvA [Flavobacteriaceae bacterium]|jgi:Holliday junction DNA helicase RuvA|nr:Holliday junction branch migration protein RuvA [Flavobacteriaceae bacterium]
MITHLSGTVFEIAPSGVVIDCNGVGYYSTISLQTYTAIHNQKQTLLYVQEIIREDAHLLFGFATKTERDLFNFLISVNGVGPASAVMMLSSMSVVEISSAIINGNSAALQKIKGIGAKTAQRVIIELRDKLLTFDTGEILTGSTNNKIKFEALSALEVLGISKRMTEKIIDKILEENPEIEVEDLIKQTLKKL